MVLQQQGGGRRAQPRASRVGGLVLVLRGIRGGFVLGAVRADGRGVCVLGSTGRARGVWGWGTVMETPTRDRSTVHDGCKHLTPSPGPRAHPYSVSSSRGSLQRRFSCKKPFLAFSKGGPQRGQCSVLTSRVLAGPRCSEHSCSRGFAPEKCPPSPFFAKEAGCLLIT